MEKRSKIYVAGHRGLVGSALVRKLKSEGYTNLLLKTRSELNLLDCHAVRAFFESARPEYVFLAAAKVGGIHANNTLGADFIYENLAIETNVVKNASDFGVRKLLFLGSTCIYPRDCPQPMKEEYFLDGKPEKTNEPYAAAKIAGILMCQAFHKQFGKNFISVMPTNLYGPNDKFDLETSHVFPALIRRFYEASRLKSPTVTLWGTGKPRREFLHVDDLADACFFLMQHYDSPDIINVGTGQDVSIREFADIVKAVARYGGEIRWDPTRPDGTPQKVADVSKINTLGWRASIPLETGIARMYEWYGAHALPFGSSQ